MTDPGSARALQPSANLSPCRPVCVRLHPRCRNRPGCGCCEAAIGCAAVLPAGICGAAALLPPRAAPAALRFGAPAQQWSPFFYRLGTLRGTAELSSFLAAQRWVLSEPPPPPLADTVATAAAVAVGVRLLAHPEARLPERRRPSLGAARAEEVGCPYPASTAAEGWQAHRPGQGSGGVRGARPWEEQGRGGMITTVQGLVTDQFTVLIPVLHAFGAMQRAFCATALRAYECIFPRGKMLISPTPN